MAQPFCYVLGAIFVFVALILPLAAEPVLRLHDGKEWKELDAAAWEKLPRAEVVAKARDGNEHRFSGVSIGEVLRLLGAPEGRAIRGEEMNRAVLLSAKDGYRVVFSLAELDGSFRKSDVILADRADGKELDDFEGPLMIVAADESRHSRWIRQVERIALVRVTLPE